MQWKFYYGMVEPSGSEGEILSVLSKNFDQSFTELFKEKMETSLLESGRSISRNFLVRSSK